MDIIKSKLESVYKQGFRTVKRDVPSSIRCIIDQFVEKGWITNVRYYVSDDYEKLIVFGDTELHHDVFYTNPLTKLLWEMGCFVAPNRHCKNILGEEGHIIIKINDFRKLLYIEKNTGFKKPYKGIEALAAVIDELFTIKRH